MAKKLKSSDLDLFPKPKKAKKKVAKKAAKKAPKKAAKKKAKIPKKPDAPTVQPVLQVAPPQPKYYLFDPSKPEAHESSRDAMHRQAWQVRLRASHEANRIALEAEQHVKDLKVHGYTDDQMARAKNAAQAAREAAAKATADVAPQPEPWEDDGQHHHQDPAKPKKKSKSKAKAKSKSKK
jgi:hypothetical protein